MHVLTQRETDKNLQPIHVAMILKEIVKQRGFDFVILGKQSIDDDFNQTGQLLSAMLGWPQISFISKLQFDPEAKKFNLEREIEGGLQNLTAPVNSIITCDLRLNKPRPAKLSDIMKSKNKPIETLKEDQFDLSSALGLDIKEVSEPPKKTGGVIVKDVDELISKLRNEAKVI